MRLNQLIVWVLLAGLLSACTKKPGRGGNFSAQGKIHVKDYDKNYTQLKREYAGSDVDVYLIYGEDLSYGDRVKTNYSGEFEFKYLYPGDYTAYVYSGDTTFRQPQVPLIRKFTVMRDAQFGSILLDSLTIYDL